MSFFGKIKGFYSEAKHIIEISYKPDVKTFKRTMKIVIIGVIILGVMAFVISYILGLLV
ncbi:MAG: preprotein translocase subunit SecE [Candidatus Micrarchaeaceae archaeon]